MKDYVPPVSYVDWDDQKKELVEKKGDDACKEYTVVDANTTTFEGGKWYVVNGDVENANRIRVTGDQPAHLILCDGKILNASWGIEVLMGTSLILHGQSYGEGANPGKLVTTIPTNEKNYAAIGGGNGGKGGIVTINDATVTARCMGNYGVGIGGGSGGEPGNTVTLTVNGANANVTAQGGEYAAGIGGAVNNGGTVTINNGTVNATGGSHDAGIGGGHNGNGDTVTIKGGAVTAQGGNSGAGIGSGYISDSVTGSAGTVTIEGGTVIAKGGTYGAGIGGGYYCAGANVNVTGGTVETDGTYGDGTYYSVGIGHGFKQSDNGQLNVGEGLYVYASDTSSTPEADITKEGGDYPRYRFMDINDKVPATKYSITVEKTGSGSVSSNFDEAAPGWDVTLTSIPETGFELTEISAVCNDIYTLDGLMDVIGDVEYSGGITKIYVSDNKLSLNDSVTIHTASAVSYDAVTGKYSVTFTGFGTLEIELNGQRKIVSFYRASDSYSFTNSQGSAKVASAPVEVTTDPNDGDKFHFTMPEGNVTVKALRAHR